MAAFAQYLSSRGTPIEHPHPHPHPHHPHHPHQPQQQAESIEFTVLSTSVRHLEKRLDMVERMLMLQSAMHPAMPQVVHPAMHPAMPQVVHPAMHPAMPQVVPQVVHPAMHQAMQPSIGNIANNTTDDMSSACHARTSAADNNNRDQLYVSPYPVEPVVSNAASSRVASPESPPGSPPGSSHVASTFSIPSGPVPSAASIILDELSPLIHPEIVIDAAFERGRRLGV